MIQGASFLENDSNKADMKLQLVHELWKSAETLLSALDLKITMLNKLIMPSISIARGKDFVIILINLFQL